MAHSGAAVDPGWYQDAYAPGVLRWFDGEQWTPHTRSAAAGPQDPLHWVVPVGRRGWAIAAGYVAIVAAFCWLLAPIALGMGVWALVDIKRHGGLGQGRAWFAIATGGVGTLLLLLIVAFSIAQP